MVIKNDNKINDLLGKSVYYLEGSRIKRNMITKIMVLHTLNMGSIKHGHFMPKEYTIVVEGAGRNLTPNEVHLKKEDIIKDL